jgi:DNA polymerase-3 subunit delta
LSGWQSGPQILARGAGAVPAVFLLAGDDGWTKEKLVVRLREAAVAPEWRESAIESFWADESPEAAVVDSAMTPPFGSPRKAVVVRKVEEWRPGGGRKRGGRGKKAKAEAGTSAPLLEYLANPSPTTCLVLVSEKWEAEKWDGDEVGQAVAALGKAGALVACTPPKGQEMAAWLEGEATILGNPLDRAAAMELVDRAGEGTLLLHAELEKLSAHAGRGGRITMEGVREVTGETSVPDIFRFLDILFVERRPGRALAALARLMMTEHPLALSAMMLNYLKKLVAFKGAVSAGMPSRSAAAKVRLPQWMADQLAMMVRRTPRERFASLLREMAEAETSLKKGGNYRAVMENLVLRVCR